MPVIPVLWTNDDILWGRLEQHQRQLAFLARHEIPGNFFLVPKAGEYTLDMDAPLLKLMEASRSHGHEYHQHGYVHDAFECGVPELWMLDFSPPTRARYDNERFKIEAVHTFEALVEMLEKGQKIWRKAFGESSTGFRPGWGAYCTNLYRALATLGYDWVSSRIPWPTSWIWNQQRWDEPATFRAEVPITPQNLFGVREYPLGGDYAFRVPNSETRINAMVDLAMEEFGRYVQAGAPFVICSHWHGLEFPGDNEAGCTKLDTGTGYAVHDRLINQLKASGQAQFMNFTQLLAWEQQQQATPVKVG